MSTKKYKLLKATGDSSKVPCAFFLSADGCRNGENCKFFHGDASAAAASIPKCAVVPDEVGSVVSSESGGESVGGDGNPFAPPPSKTEEAGGKRKNRRSLNTDPFAKKSKSSNDAPAPTSNQTPPNKNKKVKSTPNAADKKATPNKAPATTGVDFRSLNLPVSNFALPSASTHAKSDSESDAEKEVVMAKRNTIDSPPLPKSTDIGRKWLSTVQACHKNPRFAVDFNCEKAIEADEPFGGKSAWFKAKPFGDWCRNNPQIIAIDCEMCETEDPVTKKRQPSALCRISIIDGITDEVLLNTLVKPEWPVVDYRTFINGITEESLEGVEFTVAHAQAFMKALCSEETIIAGHAVHNDLKSMRMEHYCVADSALLFRAADSETATVSLKDLSFALTKKEMPKTHDSVNDARAAFRCLEHYVEKKGKVEPIPRRAAEARAAAASQLFVHRIPKHVNAKHLSDMFLNTTKIAVERVDDITPVGDGTMGKTNVTFTSAGHASLAFNTLTGPSEEDSSGKLQKKVYLRGGKYIRIRKNLVERARKSFEAAAAKPN